MNNLQKLTFYVKAFHEYPHPKFWLTRMLRVLARRTFLPQDVREKFIIAAARMVPDLAESNIFPFRRPDNPHESFVDVGSADGLHSHPVASARYKVYAFEPDPYRRQRLETYHPRNLVIEASAVSDYDGPGTLHLHRKECARIHGIVPGYYLHSIPIDVVTLDNYPFAEKVGVIKVDVEGHEPAVLRGALRLIERDTPRLILEVHSPYKSEDEELRGILEPLGYRCRKVERPKFYHGFSYHLVCEA